jgi:hypothetical protein
VPRGLEGALLDGRVEVCELVVAELGEDLVEQWQGGVVACLEDGLEGAKLAVVSVGVVVGV